MRYTRFIRPLKDAPAFVLPNHEPLTIKVLSQAVKIASTVALSKDLTFTIQSSKGCITRLRNGRFKVRQNEACRYMEEQSGKCLFELL